MEGAIFVHNPSVSPFRSFLAVETSVTVSEKIRVIARFPIAPAIASASEKSLIAELERVPAMVIASSNTSNNPFLMESTIVTVSENMRVIAIEPIDPATAICSKNDFMALLARVSANDRVSDTERAEDFTTASEMVRVSESVANTVFKYSETCDNVISSPNEIIVPLIACDTNVTVSERDLVEDFAREDASVRVWEITFPIEKLPSEETMASVCERLAKNHLFIESASVRVWESANGAMTNPHPLLFPPFVEFVAYQVLTGVAVLLDIEQ